MDRFVGPELWLIHGQQATSAIMPISPARYASIDSARIRDFHKFSILKIGEP
jgi:hypothetical protein